VLRLGDILAKGPEALVAAGLEHRELAKRFAEQLRRRGYRVKLLLPKVREEEFPWFLEYLEEMFGGVATAEYRRYGIKQLPAVAVDDRVYQGREAIRYMAGGCATRKARGRSCSGCPLNVNGVCAILGREAPGTCIIRVRLRSSSRLRRRP